MKSTRVEISPQWKLYNIMKTIEKDTRTRTYVNGKTLSSYIDSISVVKNVHITEGNSQIQYNFYQNIMTVFT